MSKRGRRGNLFSIPSHGRPLSLADLAAGKRGATQLEEALKKKVVENVAAKAAASKRMQPLGVEILDKENGAVTIQFSRPIQAWSMGADSAEQFCRLVESVVERVRERAAAAAARAASATSATEATKESEGNEPNGNPNES